MVKRGLKAPYDCFYEVFVEGLKIPYGLGYRLKKFGVVMPEVVPEYSLQDVQEYLKTTNLPFTPYRHQIQSFYESLLKKNSINLMCTGSGKSLTIAMLADFFRTKGKKGLLVVPNINLLTQFKSDIKDYNLMELYNNTFTIGGGQTIRDFSHSFTISTWQSLMNSKDSMKEFNYIMIDECLHPKTLITTSRGLISIDKLTLDNRVLTMNEFTMKLEYKKIKKIHVNLPVKSMICINDKLNITKNHKIFTNRGWVEAGDIKTGDVIIHE